MLARLSERLIAVSSGWLVLVAVVVFLLFGAFVLPRQAAQSEEQSGGVPQPDSSFIYTPVDLYGMAEALGPEGRQAYIQARWTFDVVWPLVYGFFLTTAISWLAGKAFRPGSAWRRLNLVPLTGMLFDYLENISTSLVMARYPAATPVADLLAPVCTAVKWLFVGGSFAVLAGVALVALLRALARTRASEGQA
jgi:hypothetical protein